MKFSLELPPFHMGHFVVDLFHYILLASGFHNLACLQLHSHRQKVTNLFKTPSNLASLFALHLFLQGL